MKLLTVISAKETKNTGVLELVIDAEIGCVRDQYPFGFNPDDTSGLTPAVKAWLAENAIAVEPYHGNESDAPA